MTVLTKKQLLMLHSQLIAETGGVDGLRDEGMLESAMNAPFECTHPSSRRPPACASAL